jgi:hypothetical protein
MNATISDLDQKNRMVVEKISSGKTIIRRWTHIMQIADCRLVAGFNRKECNRKDSHRCQLRVKGRWCCVFGLQLQYIETSCAASVFQVVAHAGITGITTSLYLMQGCFEMATARTGMGVQVDP